MNEIVVLVLHILIVGGLCVVLYHIGTLIRWYGELLEPVWLGVRRWIGQVVIDSGCWVVRIGARLSGVYIARFVLTTPKKLEISYE
jgi:cytochrome c biogenesis protein CcdA